MHPVSANSGYRKRTAKGALRQELGRRLVLKRKRKGWTQAELARRVGVTRERAGKWERGLNAPSLEELAALSEVLGVGIEELGLGGSPQESSSPASISAAELTELFGHLSAMARLLKPWLERQSPKTGGARGDIK